MKGAFLVLVVLVVKTYSQIVDKTINLPTCKDELTFRLLFRPRDGWKPRCSEDGNYHPQQCDVFGSCWCVNKETGRTVVGSQHRKGQAVNCDIASSCPENMVFYQCVPCVSKCQSNINEECGEECSSGCGCPLGSVLWEDTCVTTEECSKMMVQSTTVAVSPLEITTEELFANPGWGSWGAWSSWSSCSSSCGEGVQTKIRYCYDVNGSCGRIPLLMRGCYSETCKEQSIYEWSDWSDCSGRCSGGGFGVRSKTRFCTSGRFCVNQTEHQYIDCWDPYACLDETTTAAPTTAEVTTKKESEPTTATFTTAEVTTTKGIVREEWGPWSDCSGTCGNGVRVRFRTCDTDTGDCTGMESEGCIERECEETSTVAPTTAEITTKKESDETTTAASTTAEVTTKKVLIPTWSQWSTSSCSITCGLGVKMRYRFCEFGDTCEGPSQMTETCIEKSCEDPVPTWSQWSTSSCSTTCGFGKLVKYRFCQFGDSCSGAKEVMELCQQNQCEEETTTGAPTTVEGTTQKEIEETTTAVPIPTTAEVTTKKESDPVPTWSQWSTGSCSTTCGSGKFVKYRFCQFGDSCVGPKEILELCQQSQCEEETTTGAPTTVEVTTPKEIEETTTAVPIPTTAEVTTKKESEETSTAAPTTARVTTIKEREETTSGAPTTAEVTTIQNESDETTTAAKTTAEATTKNKFGDCPADRIYNECPSKCINTCDKHWPTCPSGCGENKCECKPGTIQESDTSLNCITLNECPIHQVCPSPFVPTECASFCPITCYSRTRRRCTLACDRTKECVCPRHLVLHEGSCIEMSQCPDNCAAVQEKATGNDFKPECDSNGNYLLTQHDKYSDMKFCVDKFTGKIVMETLDYAQMFTADCKALADIPENSLYSKCPSACPRTCSSNRSRYCTLACDTSKIWECKSGYVENDGTCIKPQNC